MLTSNLQQITTVRITTIEITIFQVTSYKLLELRLGIGSLAYF
jgi:hypothetical protein